eukprot:6486661-Lingulodinium_polyedra.AAC.1
MRAARNWRPRGAHGRAICQPLLQRTVDSTASLRSVSQTSPQRLANRTFARSTRARKLACTWSARACKSRAVARA